MPVREKDNEIEISRFFESERGKLEGFIRKKLYKASGMETEDIIQEVMLRALSVPMDNAISNIGAYVYRTARNWITDYFRKKSRSPETELKEGPDEKIADLLDGNSDIESILEDRAIRKALFNAVDRLTSDQRAIWEAVELDGYTYKELSEKWNIPIGTLLARKARAQDALRKILEEDEINY